MIGKQASGISRENALSYVAGYAIGLDITIRGPEDRSFRSRPTAILFWGLGWRLPMKFPNPGELDLSIAVNGEMRQASNTRHMILGVAELIELASSFYTVYPGDVFLTGTPEGVSPIVPGDCIVATIEKVGTMAVHVRNAEVRSA